MKKIKHSRRIIAGIMALLLVIQAMYSNGKMTVLAEQGGTDSTEKDSYTFLVTEEPEAEEEAGGDGQQPADNNTQPVPIQGAEITVKDGDSNPVGEALITNEEGKAVLQVDKNTDISNYTYTVTEKNHQALEDQALAGAVPDVEIAVSMEIRYEYTITGTVTADGEGLEEAEISFGEENSIVTVKTDTEGKFSADITYQKGETEMFWELSKTGYATTKGVLYKGEENLDITISPLDRKNIKVTVLSGEEGSRQPVSDVQVTLKGYALSEDGTVGSTNEEGTVVFSDIYVNGNYQVTVKKQGYVSCTREITQQELEQAAGNEAECTIILQEMGFEKTGELSVPWNEGSFQNQLQTAEGTIVPEYRIVKCVDGKGNNPAPELYAEINSSTGELTLKDLSQAQDVELPVVLTIEAVNTAAAADQETEKVSYELTITKAEQTLQWTTNLPQDKSLYYGQKDFYVGADSVGQGIGDVTYEVLTANQGNEYISVGTDGSISYLKEVPAEEVIEAEIQAVKAEDDLYLEAKDTFRLQLKRKSADGMTFILEGFKTANGVQEEAQELYLENGENGWFTGGSLKIKKENCEFATDLNSDNWEEELSFGAGDVLNGVYQKSFYLREKDGTITEQITVSGIQWDKTAPEELKISYSRSIIDIIAEKIGLYNAPVKVTVSAKDTESGIDYFAWKYTSTEEGTESAYSNLKPDKTENGVAYVTFTISREDSMKIDFNAYDKAGNVTNYADEQRIIVLDQTAPHIEVKYDNNTVDYSKDGKNYFGKKRTATIQVTEPHFSADKVMVNVSAKDIAGKDREGVKVLLNGNEVELSQLSEAMKQAENWNWSEEEGIYRADITFSEDAYYHLDIQATDLAENTSEKLKSEFGIDQTAPGELNVSYSQPVQEDVIDMLTWYYQNSVEITFEAEDICSGIDTITWQYTKEPQTSDLNRESMEETIPADKIIYSDGGKKAKAVIRLTAEEAAQYRGNITFYVTDKTGNKSGIKDDGTKIIVDNIAPTMEVTGIPAVPDGEQDGKLYFKEDIELNFRVEEANFYEEDVKIMVNGQAAECSSWDPVTEEKDCWVGTMLLTEGEHEITVEYTDRSQNKMNTYTSPVLVIDNTSPEVEISYDNNTVDYSEDGKNYFGKKRTATIQVTEPHFSADKVMVNVSAKDIAGKDREGVKFLLNGNEVELSQLSEAMKQAENWSEEEGTYYADITFLEEAYYHIDVQATDLAENTSQKSSNDFGIDRTAPGELTVSYSQPVQERVLEELIWYYQGSVEITFEAEDICSGIDTITWQYTKEAQTSDQNRESMEETISADKIIYSDGGKKATAKIRLTAEEAAQYRGNITFYVTDKIGNKSGIKDDGTKIIVDNIAPTMEVTGIPAVPDGEQDGKLYFKEDIELNFRVEEANFYAEDVKIMVNGQAAECSSWNPVTEEKDCWVGTMLLTEGEHEITVEYTDRSQNKMNTYTSPVLVVDSTAPVVDISYDNNTAANDIYYKENRTATVQITEQNFSPEGVNVTVRAEDIAGNKISDAKVLLNGKEMKLSELPEKLRDSSNWSDSETEHEVFITYLDNAYYSITVQAADLAGNSSVETGSDFWLDKTDPCELEISYSEPLLEKMLEKLTFGYYQSGVDVTFTAKDNDAGIETLTWKYTKESSASEKDQNSAEGMISSNKIIYTNQGRTATARIHLTASEAAQYRGNISFSVTDRAGNTASTQDTDHVIVVDNIAPTMTVDYAPCNQTEEKVYFNQTAVLHFHVEEANFYREDVVIKVNGKKVSCNNWTRKSGTDIWDGFVSLAADGDYRVTVEYKDRSANQMRSYTSPILVVDTVKPVIDVTYDNDQAIGSEHGNAYYDKGRTATIQITDKNFNASEVEAVVTATKADGTEAVIKDYKNYLKQAASWQKNGDVNTAVISFDTDANYTFAISYRDMAENGAEDYGEEHFTVDTGLPENMRITYSDSILETVLEHMTFGFYNAKVTVTVTVEDDVAGINRLIYSYKNAENVSGVNGQMLEQVIEKSQITYSNGGKTATAQFTIPKSELDGNNQFNGVVEVRAVDNSGNQIDITDTKRIVVDNIAPGAEVSYNEPTYQANGIDYYAEEVQGQITITEANFQAGDVQVSATRDGAPYPLTVSWSDANADIHNGSFRISEEGDYQITVNYQDKSGNTMAAYQSHQLTVDSTAPTITVEKIADHMAYNDETIGLRVLVDDVNFDVSSFQPLLTAIVQEGEGGFAVRDFSELGTVETIEEGKTYAYVIENIPEDAIYTLSCTVKDLSLNEMSEMAVVESENESMERLMFSVNRNGSTFMLDTNTRVLVENYYVTGVAEHVVVQEINCDPIEEHQVAVNGQVLQESTQYRTEDRKGENTWYQYDYIVDKEVFEEEGSYAVVVVSTDKAENVAYSDMKNVEASFVVDRTAPIVTVSGLAENGRYQVEKQTVNVMPTDDGGRLESLEINIYDSNDKLIGNAVSGSGEELLETLEANGGRMTFEIPQGVSQWVSITCTDAAGNVYEKQYQNITVSTQWYIMLLANKTVLYIGILILIIILLLLLYAVRRLSKRKKQ